MRDAERGSDRRRNAMLGPRWRFLAEASAILDANVFVAALIVGGSGGPDGLVRFTTVGIVVLLAVIYLGTRRNRAAWRDRR